MDLKSAPGRKYPVLDPDSLLKMNGSEITIKEIASFYVPILYIHPDIDNMRPVRILYEAFKARTSVFINYYVHWKDEIHPNPVFHVLYRGFRSIVYGSANDIEYIQVVASAGTGAITRIAFEHDPSGRADAPAPLHDVVICENLSGGESFNVSINGKKKNNRTIPVSGGRPSILVSTWNHIYDFYEGTGILINDPPIEFMSDDLYVKYFMHRRSRPPGP